MKKTTKKLTTIAVGRDLVTAIDIWRGSQDVAPSRVACVEAALREFIQKRKKTK